MVVLLYKCSKYSSKETFLLSCYCFRCIMICEGQRTLHLKKSISKTILFTSRSAKIWFLKFSTPRKHLKMHLLNIRNNSGAFKESSVKIICFTTTDEMYFFEYSQKKHQKRLKYINKKIEYLKKFFSLFLLIENRPDDEVTCAIV